jgi:hypothetical protein
VEDHGGTECRTHIMRSKYYAVSIPSLMKMMRYSGFDDIIRLDDRFFQPIIVGRKTLHSSDSKKRGEVVGWDQAKPTN